MKFNNLHFKPYKDLFNNYNKIKKINPGYKLYFNNKDKKFVIVNIYNNFEICKVFDTLFGNFEDDLRFSEIRNINQILQKIENDNFSLSQKFKIINSEKQALAMKNFSQISSRSTKIKQTDIDKIIGASKC